MFKRLKDLTLSDFDRVDIWTTDWEMEEAIPYSRSKDPKVAQLEREWPEDGTIILPCSISLVNSCSFDAIAIVTQCRTKTLILWKNLKRIEVPFDRKRRGLKSLRDLEEFLGMCENEIFPLEIRVKSEELGFALNQIVYAPYMSGEHEIDFTFKYPGKRRSLIKGLGF